MSAGTLIRHWLTQRHLTQQDLALRADISTRHLSFLETGRSRPTAAMILRVSEQLDIPLRHRNDILLAGGFAPAYDQTRLQAPSMAVISSAIGQILTGHLPYPALVVDRHWELIDANPAVDLLTAGCAASLLEPPVNVLRLSLHPDGLAPRIRNLDEWRGHILARLGQQFRSTGDAELARLGDELVGYPGGAGRSAGDADDYPGNTGNTGSSLVVPLRLDTARGELSLFSTTTVFGTPRDVTVSELAIESFFPADQQTAERLHRAP